MVLLHSSDLPLDIPALDFSLKGTDDKAYSLSSFTEEFLVILFICNHCPYVIAIEDDIRDLESEYKSKGINFVAINSNDAKQYPQDSFEEMKKKNYAFPYLYDESQKVAEDYQAVCTPDIFVYDKDRKLVYHARFNDAERGEQPAKSHDLKNALDDLLETRKVNFDPTPSQGCSIKWKNT